MIDELADLLGLNGHEALVATLLSVLLLEDDGGTRPALRSLAATWRPEEARGTARITSLCLASGRGWPGR